MDIQVILEASAIATIVGAGISYFTFRKSSKESMLMGKQI